MIDKARHDFIELSYVYGGALLCVLLLSSIAMPVAVPRTGLLVPKSREEKKSSFYDVKAFDAVSVRAKAFIVYDLVTKETIASRNADEPLPLASITKVMTGITALAHNSASTKIIIRKESIDGGYDLGLKKGQVWKLGELLKYTLVFSSNDGAHAIADALGGRAAFVEQMNVDSALLGIGMKFTEPAGLDKGEEVGGVGTARQTAKLFEIARKRYPELLDATTKTRVTVLASKDRIIGIPNTNQDIYTLFGAEASKTGFTDSAGGNLGVVVDITLGHPVVIVVLGSTRDGRFSDMDELYRALVKSVK